MKSVIKALFFDKSIVKAIKKSKIDKGYWYNELFSGRITLEEYVRAGL